MSIVVAKRMMSIALTPTVMFVAATTAYACCHHACPSRAFIDEEEG